MTLRGVEFKLKIKNRDCPQDRHRAELPYQLQEKRWQVTGIESDRERGRGQGRG